MKVAVIGATHPNLHRWLWGERSKGFNVESIHQAVERIMPEVLDARPDLIILAVHYGSFPGGEGEDNLIRMAREFPQIDLILGGHIHQENPGERIGPRSWYAAAGKGAEYLVRVNIVYDTEKKCVTSIQSLLISAADFPENVNIQDKISADLKKAEVFAATRIGKTTCPIRPIHQGEFEASMNTLLCESIASAAHADIAFHGTLNPFKEFKGDITEQDLFDAVPFENMIGVLSLTPEDVRRVLQEQLSVYQAKDVSRFQSPWGLRYEMDAKHNVKVILHSSGAPFSKNERLRVAFNSYTLAGAGGRFPILKKLGEDPTNHPKDTGILTRDAVRDHIRKSGHSSN